MKFTLESPTAVTIRSISENEILIGEQRWSQTIALTGSGVVEGWHEKPVESLSADDFLKIFDAKPDVIVLGTGATHVIPPRELVFAMARNGVGFETMDTRAAARTFNVLAGEGRQVAAVLYL